MGMNYTKKILLLLSIVLNGVGISAQTADKVIDNYLKAIGGKDAIAKMKSLYYESTIDIMGMSGNMRTTVLNGKGYKQEMEIMGSTIVTCFSETGGWDINPGKSGNAAIVMSEKEYNDKKNQIFIGAPFIVYKENGYTAEIINTEMLDGLSTTKLRVTSPSNISSDYYFDSKTSLIVKVVQAGEMGETISTYSDYRDVDGGYKLPFKIDTDMGGGQVKMKMTVQKASLNVAVDKAIFEK